MHCLGCGAPLSTYKCEYCLTISNKDIPKKQDRLEYVSEGRYGFGWTDPRTIYCAMTDNRYLVGK